MSPESLREVVYITLSDVWSYGVVIWEMATMALEPYAELSNAQVIQFVQDRKVMKRPEDCHNLLYGLMNKCWKYEANERPSFLDIIEDLLPEYFWQKYSGRYNS